MKRINKILIELKKFSPKILTLKPPLADNKKVERFEGKHALLLPKDYKYLLSLHDGFDLMGTMVYGFAGNENIESVYDFEHFEVNYPQYNFLVPFSNDGAGNFYCFDTSDQSDNQKSCKIVFWISNYEYNENDKPEIVNTSFAAWIEEVVIGWTLESYNYDGSPK